MMATFDLIAALLVLTAGLSYLNYRLLRLPPSIGLMALTLLVSVAVVVVGHFLPTLEHQAQRFVSQFDFSQALLHGMLGFLLFAGSLHLSLNELAQQKLTIAALATLGVVLSTLVVGGLTWTVFWGLGQSMPPIYCLLFGALISPTDPIAVLAMLKHLKAPRPLEVTIAGESLFNDGVGVVVFLGLLEVAVGGHGFEPGRLARLFLQEAVGGAVFGLLAGLVVYWLLKSVDAYQVEILLSLALVAGGYALAEALNLSGPIAMVVAGLVIGNHGRQFAMSSETSRNLDLFWELVDEILNAVLFVLMGLEMLVITFTTSYLVAGVLAIVIVLVGRLVSVGLATWMLRRLQPVDRATFRILIWGGLRGGLSVAMALSLPTHLDGSEVPEREGILVITYVVVVFSILVQGLTIGPLTRRWLAGAVRPVVGLKEAASGAGDSAE